jgi:hypothetical protein
MALIGCLFATAVQISRYISSTVWIGAFKTLIEFNDTAGERDIACHRALEAVPTYPLLICKTILPRV